MRTMDEIIGSIKDEKLRNFALGLQKKLEVAQNAIVKKTKKGQAVSNAEKEALKNSVANYTEKNRVLIPKTVATLLASALLVSMLASCDGNVNKGEANVDNTFETEMPSQLPVYGTLDVEEFSGEV